MICQFFLSSLVDHKWSVHIWSHDNSFPITTKCYQVHLTLYMLCFILWGHISTSVIMVLTLHVSMTHGWLSYTENSSYWLLHNTLSICIWLSCSKLLNAQSFIHISALQAWCFSTPKSAELLSLFLFAWFFANHNGFADYFPGIRAIFPVECNNSCIF